MSRGCGGRRRCDGSCASSATSSPSSCAGMLLLEELRKLVVRRQCAGDLGAGHGQQSQAGGAPRTRGVGSHFDTSTSVTGTRATPTARSHCAGESNSTRNGCRSGGRRTTAPWNAAAAMPEQQAGVGQQADLRHRAAPATTAVRSADSRRCSCQRSGLGALRPADDYSACSRSPESCRRCRGNPAR